MPVQETAVPFISSTQEPFISSTRAPYFSSTQEPFISSTRPPYFSSTPGPFISRIIPTEFGSSTPAPFVSSSQFASPSPYDAPYRGFVGSPTTPSPIVSSSTPLASTVSPFSVSRRPHFPFYGQRTVPFQGYAYSNPKINRPYSVVSQQTPAPIFYPSSSEQRFPYTTAQSNINSRITTTLSPPPRVSDFDEFSPTRSPFNDGFEPVQFKQYIPPYQPNTILITPKPSFNQPPLPNSLTFNQNLLPPLTVAPLNSEFSGPNNFNDNFRENTNFINNPPYDFNRPLPQTVAPLTVTNLNFRKKRDFKKE